MPAPLARLVNRLPCVCGGVHPKRLTLEGAPVLECPKAKDNGLYLHWAQGRPYFVTGPEPDKGRSDGRQ